MCSEACPETKSNVSWSKIFRDVISDIFIDVSKDKNLIYFVELSFMSYFKDITRRGFVKAISRDTISDMSSDTLTKQVVTIVDCSMMFLAKVRNFCLSRMKECRSYYILFT